LGCANHADRQHALVYQRIGFGASRSTISARSIGAKSASVSPKRSRISG